MKKCWYVNRFKDSPVISELIFTSALSQWKVIYDAPNPDIVFIHSFHNEGIFYQAMKIRMKFGWKPLLCMYYREPGSLPQGDWLNYTFSYNATDSKNCQQILAEPVIYATGNLQLFNSNRIARIRPKTHFCNFVYRSSLPRTEVRNNFCQQLMKYKRVDCPGDAMNNMPNIKKYSDPGGAEAKLDFIANYKFTIAFENTSDEYYISEKILHPLMVGSVPIYWGSPKIAEYFNPECFINCHDYNSFSQVIERIKEIDNDPKLYQKYIEADPILSNSRLYEVRQQFIDRLAHIGEEILQRRNASYPNKLMSLWKVLILIWKNKYLISRLQKRKHQLNLNRKTKR